MKTIEELNAEITEQNLMEASRIPLLGVWTLAAALANAAMGNDYEIQMTSLFSAFVLGRLYERERARGTVEFVVREEK